MNSALPRVRATTLTRKGAVLLATACVACLGACGGSGSSGSTGTAHVVGGLPIEAADPGATSQSHVTYTSRTVVVDPTIVDNDLVGVSADGSSYTFSGDPGPLGELAPGKVMLLEGFDVANVTSVDHVGGKLIVHTTPVTLTDLVQSGQIEVKSPPDFASGFGAVLGGSPIPAASSFAYRLPVGHSRMGSAELDAYDEPCPQVSCQPVVFSYTFTIGKFTYTIAFSPGSGGDNVSFSGQICYQLTSKKLGAFGKPGACAGSRTGGITLSFSVDGNLRWSDMTTDITVVKGRVVTSSYSLSGLVGNLTFGWTAARGGGGQAAADPPVLKVPFDFEFPLCPPTTCGAPLYGKVGLALYVKIAVPGKNSVFSGGQTVTFGASNALAQSGQRSVAGSGSGDSIHGSFAKPAEFAFAASGLVVAVQLKLCAGLGVKSLNALYCLAFVASLGQTTGGEVVEQHNCSTYQALYTISGNYEIQLGNFTYAGKPYTFKTLKPKPYTYGSCLPDLVLP